jgi:hypothetical protein
MTNTGYYYTTADYTVDSYLQECTIAVNAGIEQLNSWLRLMSSFVSNCHLNLSLYFPVCV